MGRRALVGTFATLGLVALVGMFAALSLLFSSPGPAYAETNSAPEFSSDAITLVVDEYTDVSEGSTPWYRSIGDPVTATDANNDKLIYSLENSSTSYFTIHSKTGQLEAGAPLDYETESSYTVKVIATDPEGDKDTVTVTITVTNVEEPGRVSLYWDQPQVSANLKATLTDPDGVVVTSNTTWQWAKSSDGSNNWTNIGTSSDSYTPADADVGSYLRATASYTDGHDPGKTADTVSVRAVRAAPEPNSDPAFDKTNPGGYGCIIDGETGICRHISRSTPVGYYIYYPFRATDPIDRDEIRYSLAGTKADSFRIDPSRGDLFTTKANVWGDSAFTITITATDPSGGTGDIKVKLTPSGGELNPAVEGPSRITYPENGTWPLATYIATRLRHTSDGEGEGPIRTTGWIISVEPGGGDGDFFRMNDDGLLTFIQPPDYDDPADENGDNRYSFSITAYDGNPPPGERPGKSFYNVTVTVVNVDETLEISGPSVVNHPENSREVSTYTLPEANGPVTWSVSGTDGQWFSINGGVLTFDSPPDYEDKKDLDGGGDKGDQPDNAYLVAITVEDNTNIKTEHVRVQVTNVNEPPAFNDDLETTITVEPDIGPSTQVGDPYTATDPDKGADLAYSLSTNTLPFSIDSYNGQLSTVDPLPQFDRTSYTVTVLVTDNSDDEGNSDTTADDTITVTITVGDGGGNTDPEFPAAAVSFSIAEKITTVESVGTPVTATDDDNDTPTYTLGGTDGGFFTIGSTSGQIQTKTGQTYDFETKPTYSVTVTANDGKGGTANKAVTISLINVEEAGAVTLSTDQPTARVAITATVTDPDYGITGTTWQWSKSDSPNGTYDNISSATSATYIPADGDVGKFLKATASYDDDEGSGRSAEASTTSAVQSGTNRAPDFGDLTATRDVAENTAANGNVGAVAGATDLDSDDLAYSLTSTDASSFTVDNTGQIKVGATTMLDYESAKNTYTVVVQVTDSKDAAGNTETNPTIDDTIAVTINVTDVEEAGTVTLSNYQPPARVEITATLTDPDGGVTNTTWQWARTLDPANNPWQDITGATSSSYTPPDTDLTYYLRATASYTDRKGSGKNAEAETTQAVGAGANRSPDFGPNTTTRSFPENTAAGENIGDVVEADDPDTGNTLIYTLEGTDKDSFEIDSSSGQIKTKSGVTYDHEDDDSYSVTVKADDNNGGTDTIDVTINVTDVNEKPEFPSTETGDRSIPENTVAGQPIGDPVEADDPENDSLTYSLSGTDVADFTIVTMSGQLQTKSALDKETKDSYTVTVSVHDGKNEAGGSDTTVDATIDVRITVTGENDPPTVSGQTTVNHAENDAGTVATYTATDPEGVTTFTWTLSGDDAGDFAIDEGTLTFSTTPNFESAADEDTNNVYMVTVEASDGTVKGTLAVTITVTNVNEKPSFTETAPATRSVAENTATGQDIGNPVEAEDPETGDTLFYSLDITSAASFDIDSSTGQLQTKASLDKEDKASYTVTVSVRDSKNDAGGADVAVDDEITVTITVTGENDPPEITGRSRVSYAENRTDAVANYTATDPEGVTTFTWSLSGDDEGDFSISNTGELTFQTPPDHEAPADADTNNIYLVTVRADDGNGATDTFGVTVTVADVNEPPLKPGTPAVSRTSNNVVSVTWTAPDNTGRPPILHYIYQYKKDTEPDWSGATFTTSGPTASVTIVTLDAGTSYDVEVRAINDEGPGPWSAKGTGSTNSLPDFSSATPAREVAENTVGVTSVGAPVTATDANSDSLSYTLEGADANSFHIVSASGQIQTKADVTYDHETDDSYTVTVKADDSNGGTDTIEVTITVTDVNEAPAFDGATTARDVPENTGADTGIGSPVEAEDPDAGATLTYSLGGTDASSFDIDTSTGQLKTKDALDHETNASYTVIVSVHDGKNAAGNPDPATDDEITVTITVTDANDPPEFDPNTATREVAENTAANINIGSPVRATDADNDTLTYTLEGTDHGSFSIDELSGQLKTKSALDHEAKESYTVRVKASDGNDGVDTIDVTITVTDVNEPPDFDSETATRNVPENTAAGDPVGPAVPAVDPDDGDSLTYSLGGTDSASFGINGSTGQITVGTGTTPDFETKLRYEVTVTATDSSNLSDTITVTINVTEGNDPPAFATDTATRRVAENTPASINLGDAFSATDADNNNLTYTLEGTDAASFDIVSTSGQLQTKAVLDYEVKSSYSVTVKAADASANGTIDVTITVTDVNEPPLAPGRPDVSEKSASSVSVTWTAPANQGRPAIMGYDYQYKKTDEPTWSGATYATTGVVTSATISGLDSSTSYDVQARAKNDEGTGSWSVTGAGSTGNTTPAFSSPTVTRDVAENTPADVNIGDPVAATDDDNGDSLTYTLGGVDAAAFDIDSKTGQLKTKALLDREGTKNTYTVMVTATDSASATAEATVTITVTNVNELPAFLPGETGFRVVNENTAAGQNIGVPVGADDPDTGDTLTYTLDGTDAASFAIVASTGQLKTKEPLDYETKSNYSVTVSVSDGKDANGGVEATADATIPVTIVVDDMNEPPVFDPGAANRTIAENTAADRDIGSPFTATDPDDYTLSYSLGGTDAAIFRINASTGQLQTRGPLDHEVKPSYTVTVSVHDGKAIDGNPSPATDATVTRDYHRYRRGRGWNVDPVVGAAAGRHRLDRDPGGP